MAIDPTPKDPAEERLEARVDYATRRLARAQAKRLAAEDEQEEAEDYLTAASAALAAWREANPDPQPNLL